MIIGIETFTASLLCFLTYFALRSLKREIQLIFSLIFIVEGILMGFMIGTTTVFVLPGLSGIGMGGAFGATIGYLSYLLIGTVGVATGGIGLALGAIGMSLIGFTFGALGATAGGLGLQTIHNWVVAIPVVILGFCMLYRVLTIKEIVDTTQLIN